MDKKKKLIQQIKRKKDVIAKKLYLTIKLEIFYLFNNKIRIIIYFENKKYLILKV